jgi:hypothetical protein
MSDLLDKLTRDLTPRDLNRILVQDEPYELADRMAYHRRRLGERACDRLLVMVVESATYQLKATGGVDPWQLLADVLHGEPARAESTRGALLSMAADERGKKA